MQHTSYSLHQNAHLQTRSATPTFPKEQFEQEPSDTQPLAAFTFAVLFVGLFLTLSRRFVNFPLCLAAAGSVQELKGARGGCRSSCLGCRGAASCISSLGLLIASERLSVPISTPWALIKVTTLRVLLRKKKSQPKKTTKNQPKWEKNHQTANQKQPAKLWRENKWKYFFLMKLKICFLDYGRRKKPYTLCISEVCMLCALSLYLKSTIEPPHNSQFSGHK